MTLPSAPARKVNPPLTELRAWLAESAVRCRAMRWFGALFRLSVAQDIAADVASGEAAAAREAYAAQQEDNEAERELAAARDYLEHALKDGLGASDMASVREALGRLKRARNHISRSGERDRRISEQFAHA